MSAEEPELVCLLTAPDCINNIVKCVWLNWDVLLEKILLNSADSPATYGMAALWRLFPSSSCVVALRLVQVSTGSSSLTHVGVRVTSLLRHKRGRRLHGDPRRIGADPPRRLSTVCPPTAAGWGGGGHDRLSEKAA